jgi:hypothetical protein
MRLIIELERIEMAKKEYSPPKLKKLGSIQKLTKRKTAGASDGRKSKI